jgi:hypothetical protein
VAEDRRDDNKFMPLDWMAYAQLYVKLSAAEAEVVSAVHGMRVGLRYTASWSMITGGAWDWGEERTGQAVPRPCDTLLQRQDNTACVKVMHRGWSMLLSHVPVVYGVSVAWGAERIQEGRVRMVYEKTNKMLADPLTKMTAASVLFERGLLRSTNPL